MANSRRVAVLALFLLTAGAGPLAAQAVQPPPIPATAPQATAPDDQGNRLDRPATAMPWRDPSGLTRDPFGPPPSIGRGLAARPLGTDGADG